jgi:predicted MFS family arabinose efflux permease
LSKRFSDLFSPLRYRDFRRLWGAEIFSQLGDWAGRLALSVIVAERTHSALLTALVTTVSVLPYIGLGQLLATYANRFPRIRTIIVCDVGRAVLYAVLTVRMPIAFVLILAFLAGCMTPPFEAVRNSLTPFTVPTERYGDAIALVSITFDMSVLFGYAIGGGLIAVVGAQTALLMNAVSFLISALLLIRIATARHNPFEGPPVKVRDGWYGLVDDPFVRRFFTGYMWVGACAVVGESLVALYAIEVLHREASTSGLLAAAIPAGAILGTVLGRSHGNDTQKLRVASIVALLGSLVGLGLFVAAPGIPAILIGFAGIGALNASRVPANEIAVVRLDDRIRVPTFAVLNGFLLGSQAIAAGLGGLVARGIGVRQTIIGSLVISAIVGLWGALRPPHEIRHRIRSSTTPH